jgi:hypothetical protein
MHSDHAAERRNIAVHQIGVRPISTPALMSAAFLIALAIATVVLVIFGFGERGATIALRATARWSFLLFWLAYAGGAIAWLWPRANGLGRYGRGLGLAYASAQLIHVGLVLWLVHVATGPTSAMLFFWIGIFCTYLLALFSLPRFQDALEPRLWHLLRTIALEYIAIVFTADFVTLHSHELTKQPLSYVPFILLLVSGACLRFVAFWHRRLRPWCVRPNLKALGQPRQIARTLGSHCVVGAPLLIFVAIIVALLEVDDALSEAFSAAETLYGPLVVLIVVYVSLKSLSRGVIFIGSRLHRNVC